MAEKANEGADLVRMSASYALSDHVANLTLTATAKIDAIGNSLANTIIGNSGSNMLDGNEVLKDGSGTDVFAFKSVRDGAAAAPGRDVIDDFSHKQGDRIDLPAIDANTSKSGNQIFAFIGTEKFHKKAGELCCRVRMDAANEARR